ncbi:MAG TPA: DUF971 domain-containing protein [Stellaceae bacterium]|nr:DUF971 domain-containing protein [Stellaceae bacterium]
MSAASPWPTEIRLGEQGRKLAVSFDDGRHFDFTAEYLRVESPSAEVQGHGPDQKRLVAGKSQIRITAIEPVGHYAVRLVFDDGHDTGIYSWSRLMEMGINHDAWWMAYLDALGRAGLKRR